MFIRLMYEILDKKSAQDIKMKRSTFPRDSFWPKNVTLGMSKHDLSLPRGKNHPPEYYQKNHPFLPRGRSQNKNTKIEHTLGGV